LIAYTAESKKVNAFSGNQGWQRPTRLHLTRDHSNLMAVVPGGPRSLDQIVYFTRRRVADKLAG
jgi:hypothetical protein